jgi:hypothetical protein
MTLGKTARCGSRFRTKGESRRWMWATIGLWDMAGRRIEALKEALV